MRMDSQLTRPSRLATLSILTAAVLWFFMFSPWTRGTINFWLMMAVSGVVLSTFAFFGRRTWRVELKLNATTLVLGIVIAAALWIVFWTGDKVSSWLFNFARPEVNAIYGLKSTTSPWIVGTVLLFVIGPAEEIFWRGYLQHHFTRRLGANVGFILTTAIYTLVHIWSFNLMLVLSALVAGFAWGLLYRLFPRQLGAIILSHALWDCVVFVVLPIS